MIHMIILAHSLLFFSPSSRENVSTFLPAPRFYAVCDEKKPLPSHASPGWCGPLRKTKAEAEADAEKHNETYKDHKATVCSGSCPTCE